MIIPYGNVLLDYDLTLPPARSNLSVLTGMMPRGATVEQIWRAKHLVQSAYRPNSDELMNVFGRMSFQAPGGMAITGLLLPSPRRPHSGCPASCNRPNSPWWAMSQSNKSVPACAPVLTCGSTRPIVASNAGSCECRRTGSSMSSDAF